MIGEQHLTLAIEAAIAGGSLSLIRGDQELGNRIGKADVSKAEALLVDIDAMLTGSGVSKHDIDLVAVSAGPGSFTGIRIGIATALGLKVGLGIPMTSVSALESICRTAGCLPASNVLAVAVPVGRDSICVQRFEISEREVKAIDAPNSIPESELEALQADYIVLHAALFQKYSTLPNAIDFGANLAYAVGRLAAVSPGSLTEPLFISKSF